MLNVYTFSVKYCIYFADIKRLNTRALPIAKIFFA